MFKISRLITSPNPGTNSLPFGAAGAAGAGLEPEVWVDVVVAASAFGSGFDSCFASGFASGFGADAVSTVGAGETGVLGGGGGDTSTGGGSGAGGGGSGAGAGMLIGLTGLTGLLTFVGLVIDFTHVFCVSAHAAATGCP